MKRGFLLKSSPKHVKSENSTTNETVARNTNPSLKADDPTTNPGLADQCRDAQIIGFRTTGTIATAIGIARYPFSKLDHPDYAILFTRLPTDSSNGPSTELVLHACVKRMILSTPGFPAPLPSHSESAPYVIQTTGSPMGLGMYATRDLKVGDMILAERPLMVFPETIDIRVLPGFHFGLISCSADSMFEQVLVFAAGRMDQEKRKAYLELANCHQDTKFTMVGIRDTNSFRIPEFDHNVGAHTIHYSCVMKEMSRINHSCAPNAMRSFDVPSLSYQVYAARSIAKGEQIFLSYHCRDDTTVADRKSFLRDFKISCTCLICSLSSKELILCDRFRTSLPKRIDDLEVKVRLLLPTSLNPLEILRPPSMGVYSLVDETASIISDMERYGMEASPLYLQALSCLGALYSRLQFFDHSYMKKSTVVSKKCEILRRIQNHEYNRFRPVNLYPI